jgi:hypothetical protein
MHPIEPSWMMDQGDFMRVFPINGCRNVVYAAMIAALLISACAVEPASEPSTSESQAELSKCLVCGLPPGGLYAAFRVGPETFKQHITSPAGIAGAIALWRGMSTADIPVGTLSCKCTGWNCAWDFHMAPESVTFAHSAIEICDGLPSYVNNHCGEFGGGSYCPWSAVMIVLRDCRTNALCPVVPR